MADVGSSSTNLPLGNSTTPNADALGVDPSLDSIAAYIVAAQQAWTSHDAGTVNDQLQALWSAEAALDPSTLQGQSVGSLIGGTIQQDLTALDGYSHRILAFEYLWQISQAGATPQNIPATAQLAATEFGRAVTDWNAVGLAVQAKNDALSQSQCASWGAQSAANWVDDSFTAAVIATVNSDIQAAGNLIGNVGSTLSFLTSTPVLIGLGILAVWAFFRGRR
jgi:hypothetical protein